MERWPSELWQGVFAIPTPEAQAAQAWVNIAGHYQTRRHFMHRDTSHDAHLAYCVGGEGVVRLGNAEFIIRAGDAFHLPPHLPHTYFSDHLRGWDLWWLHYSGSYAEHLAQYAGLTVSHPVVHLAEAAHLESYFARIIALLEEKPPHYLLDTTRELIALLLQIKKSTITPSAVPDLVGMLDYSADSLDAVAASLGYSKSHFIRLFQRATGNTPWRYILQLKIDKAKELLLDRRLSVQQVAHTVGMADANYFSRCFKRHVGLSPRAFRQGHATAISKL